MLLAGLLGWALLATVTAVVFGALGRSGLRDEQVTDAATVRR